MLWEGAERLFFHLRPIVLVVLFLRWGHPFITEVLESNPIRLFSVGLFQGKGLWQKTSYDSKAKKRISPKYSCAKLSINEWYYAYGVVGLCYSILYFIERRTRNFKLNHPFRSLPIKTISAIRSYLFWIHTYSNISDT